MIDIEEVKPIVQDIMKKRKAGAKKKVEELTLKCEQMRQMGVSYKERKAQADLLFYYQDIATQTSAQVLPLKEWATMDDVEIIKRRGLKWFVTTYWKNIVHIKTAEDIRVEK